MYHEMFFGKKNNHHKEHFVEKDFKSKNDTCDRFQKIFLNYTGPFDLNQNNVLYIDNVR